MKIIFPITFDLWRNWRGGYQLALGAIRAMKQTGLETEVTFLYVYPGIAPQPHFAELGREVQMEGNVESTNWLVQQKDSSGSTVLFSLGHCGLWPIAVPRVVYVPDFQHEYLMENFSKEELESRRVGYQLETATASGVWVSSQSVLDDLKKFIINRPKNELLLPFPSLRTKNEPQGAKASSELNRFILCVSQNWPHKNIGRLLEVWSSLISREPKLGDRTLVIAGKGVGVFKGQVQNLKVFEDVEDSFLESLFKTADAFVLPTTFEGWSTPVEEAIAHGLPLILSNIPILREQASKGAVFFEPSNIESMASQISSVLLEPEKLSKLKHDVRLNSRLTLEEYGLQLYKFMKKMAKE
jgi:glycosyltransferase involved in cell wall biosynthesis